MTARFADTSYFLALLIPNDENHGAALTLASQWSGPLMTTDWVLVELANHLSPSRSRATFGQFVRALAGDRRMTIVSASGDLMRRGVELYDSRPDKEWSLTDCLSFIVMRDQRLTEALSADHHFEQAGFTLLMK
jgi:predicted nucleic acid-binding protein